MLSGAALSRASAALQTLASGVISRASKLNLFKANIKDGSKLLDIGTGEGATTLNFIESSGIKFSKIIGSDINLELMEFANKAYGNSITSFEVFDLFDEIPDKIKSSAPFDLVSSINCFHIFSREEVKKPILKTKSLLKENGYFYFLFPLDLTPQKLESELLKKYPQGTVDITPAIKYYKTVMKDEKYVEDLREFLIAEGFELILYETTSSLSTCEYGDLNQLFRIFKPYYKVIDEKYREQVLDDIVEIYKDSNKEQTGDPFTRKFTCIHCMAKLAKK